MPKVRIKQAVGGKDFAWSPGQVVDMSEADAAKWADGERAERVEKKPERAAKHSKGGGRDSEPEIR